MKRDLFFTAVTIVLIGTILLIGEFSLRLWVRISNKNTFQQLMVANRLFQYQLKSNIVTPNLRTNSLGFRGEEFLRTKL